MKLELITLEKLKALLRYDPLTGDFIWLVSRGRALAGAKAGKIEANGYVQIQIASKLYLAHRLAWFYVHGAWPPDQLDHVNRLRADNREVNLRCVTRSENMQNTGPAPNNTSGFKGVYFDPRWNHWRAKIKINGRGKHLGCFKTPEAAADAYRVAAAKLHTHNSVVDA